MLLMQTVVLAAIFLVPTITLAVGLKLAGRKVAFVPLIWAGFAFAVYIILLKSRSVVPVPVFLEAVPTIWFGKVLSLTGTVAMLYFLPRVSFREAGLTMNQNSGSLPPVIITGAFTIVGASVTSYFFTYSPNTSLENLLFQATLPGLDEELFMRGLLLLLFHQAFGRGWSLWGAQTGWALCLVVAIFGLLHGVSAENGELRISLAAIVSTGFVGFILTWMRERTGSLVAPIVFHNLFNVTQAFV